LSNGLENFDQIADDWFGLVLIPRNQPMVRNGLQSEV
jgi:hypothetical protein